MSGIEPAGNGMDRLPCGCLIGSAGDVFLMEPCSTTCEYYQYAVRESERQGKPVTVVDLGSGQHGPTADYGEG